MGESKIKRLGVRSHRILGRRDEMTAWDTAVTSTSSWIRQVDRVAIYAGPGNAYIRSLISG